MRRAVRILLLLFVLVANAKWSAAQPAISWTPVKLSLQSLRGTTKVLNVSITSNTDIEDVDLTVVPALGGFLRLFPSHFARLYAARPVTVSISFSVAEDTPPQTYEGTVQLRRATNVLARPLPVTLTVTNSSSTVVPAGVSLPSYDRLVTDSATGLIFAKNEVIVYIKPGYTQAEVLLLAQKFGGTVIGSEAILQFYQLLSPAASLDEVSNVITALGNEPVVKFAVPHFLGFTIETIPHDPSWDFGSRTFRSWSQDKVHLPDAWGLTKGSANTTIGIVDIGFDSEHEDLDINKSQSDLQFNFYGFPGSWNPSDFNRCGGGRQWEGSCRSHVAIKFGRL